MVVSVIFSALAVTAGFADSVFVVVVVVVVLFLVVVVSVAAGPDVGFIRF